MTTKQIIRNWTSTSGKNIKINVVIGNRGNLSGAITNQAGTFKVNRIIIQQGKKVAPFNYQGKVAYQVLPNAIYEEIDLALRANFEATEEEILEQKISDAKRNYHNALNIGPIEANKWLDEWNKLSAELAKIK